MIWQRIIRWILTPYRKYQERKLIKERIKKLQEQDPFIYK